VKRPRLKKSASFSHSGKIPVRKYYPGTLAWITGNNGMDWNTIQDYPGMLVLVIGSTFLSDPEFIRITLFKFIV